VSTGVPEVEAWVNALRTAFGGQVSHAHGIGDCSTDRLRGADVIAFPLRAPASAAQLAAVSRLLQECTHPVLFVPYSEKSVERSSS
jgi:hypothetical protein